MATYTNLTSLEGLKPGDIVNYTITTAFDAKGYKFKVELYGKKVNTSNGGLTKLTMDSSLLPSTILSYNSRGDLIYGNTTDVYYRIAVAGDAGKSGYSITYSGGKGGNGGGNTGGNGSSDGSGLGGNGGTQTSGVFGGYGRGGTISSAYGGDGGYGWYGGNGGTTNGYGSGGGGGGSGFIIGISTSTYPSGYLGNNTDLRNVLTQSISEGSLTQGGSTSYTAKMIITIESAGESAVTQSVISYYDGTQFINTNAKYYNGTEFVDCDALYYNGNEFVKIGG